jgi:uncharacterized RDD family membrane protein YckC
MKDWTKKSFSPYEPPKASMLEEATDNKFELAGRGKRLMAYLIDTLLYIVTTFPLIISIERNPEAEPTMAVTIMVVLMIALTIVNFVLLYRYGQTIGKRLLSIKIVRTDYSRAGLLRIIFLRALPIGLLSSIPGVGGIISLVDPLLIFQDSRRCLHDHLADTIVINVNNPSVRAF